jgi:hypothetical protein
MRRFGRLRAIVMSFYSRDLYRDVGKNWTGIGLLYLTLLLAICWLPSVARWITGLRSFAETDAPAFARQLPAVTIKDGIMQASPPGRHVIRDPDPSSREPLILIIDDTIDAVPDLDEAAAVLTRREFGMIRPARGERRIFKLTSAADMAVTPDDVEAFLRSLQVWLPPVLYLFCLVGSLIFRFAQICLYAAFVQMFARKAHAGGSWIPDYRTALRLAAVAVTPVIVIRTLLWFGPSEPAWYIRWPVALVITILYLRFAARSAAPEAVEPVPPPPAPA